MARLAVKQRLHDACIFARVKYGHAREISFMQVRQGSKGLNLKEVSTYRIIDDSILGYSAVYSRWSRPLQ
jgi:hypothetical protein